MSIFLLLKFGKKISLLPRPQALVNVFTQVLNWDSSLWGQHTGMYEFLLAHRTKSFPFLGNKVLPLKTRTCRCVAIELSQFTNRTCVKTLTRTWVGGWTRTRLLDWPISLPKFIIYVLLRWNIDSDFPCNTKRCHTSNSANASPAGDHYRRVPHCPQG